MRKIILTLIYMPIVLFAHKDIKKVEYVENKGQWKPNILYKANIPEGSVFLEKNLFTYSFHNSMQLKEFHHHRCEKEEKDLYLDKFAFKMEFLGANEEIIITGEELLPEYHNYFIGNDKNKWRGKVPIYNLVKYASIYNGIDLKVYSEDSFLKYDFIISKDGNPNEIQLYYNGVVPRLKNNQIEMDIGFNTIIEQLPIAYQIINGKKYEVDCRFQLKDNIISFVFPDGYNSEYELIIDPILVASTLSGTVGADNYGHTATYGNEGEIFTGAISFGTGYPTHLGSFQISHGGSIDIAISKLNASGSALLWATYLGGTLGDLPHSMIVNSSNEIYVYGSSHSTNYPTSISAFQNNNQGMSDIVITHLSQDGANVIGSTYLGGSDQDGQNVISWNYGDTYRGEIMLDQMDNPFIASVSLSTDFPVTAGVLQNNNAGGQDGVICKLNPSLSVLEWSTYLGSPSDDAAYGLRIDNNQNVYVTGVASTGFPTTNGSAIPNFIGGSHDAFICKINPQGSTLLASSYFGSTNKDASFFLDIDLNNNIYIYGQNFASIPITSGYYGVPNSGIFITKFNNDLTNIEWQTCIGNGNGNPDLVPIAFMVDICNHIYISGHSASLGIYTTPNAFYTTGGFYLMTLEPDASAVNFATYYSNNHVDGGTSRFDPSGTVYQAVCSGGGFAATPNAHSTVQATGWDIGVFKINFELINIANAIANPSDTGCAPYTVNFTNSSVGATSYFWDFDDNGQTSTSVSPTHTFNNPGIYDVTLIVLDSGSCNISDTTILQIDVLDPNTSAEFSDTACDSYTWNGVTYNQSGTYSNVTTSTLGCVHTDTLNLIINSSDATSDLVTSCDSYIWDGVTYTSSGAYTNVYANTAGCDSVHTLNLTINNITTSTSTATACDVYTWDGVTYTTSGVYTNTYINADGCDSIHILNLTINNSTLELSSETACDSYTWDAVTYTKSGTYTNIYTSSSGCDSICTLALTINNSTSSVFNQLSCDNYIWMVNGQSYDTSGIYIDTIVNIMGCDSLVTLDLYVSAPEASFEYYQYDFCKPEIQFLNTSTDYVNSIWNFGDGNMSNKFSNTHTYIQSDEYLVTLIVESDISCLDSISLYITPKDYNLFLPNSFTPRTNDDINDIFKPSLDSLSNYEMFIYNRWGKNIFYSNNIKYGWDGTYDNTICQHGVYAWKIKYSCGGRQEIDYGIVYLLR